MVGALGLMPYVMVGYSKYAAGTWPHGAVHRWTNRAKEGWDEPEINWTRDMQYKSYMPLPEDNHDYVLDQRQQLIRRTHTYYLEPRLEFGEHPAPPPPVLPITDQVGLRDLYGQAYPRRTLNFFEERLEKERAKAEAEGRYHRDPLNLERFYRRYIGKEYQEQHRKFVLENWKGHEHALKGYRPPYMRVHPDDLSDPDAYYTPMKPVEHAPLTGFYSWMKIHQKMPATDVAPIPVAGANIDELQVAQARRGIGADKAAVAAHGKTA